MCRPPVRDENVRIANCANCHFKIQDRGEVCAQSSAPRAAMGHWGHSPHIPGMAGQCVVTFGGQTHTTTTTFGVADTVFDGSNCGAGVVRWCAHHLQHLGSPWGIGGNAPTPQGWQDTAWSPWGRHTNTTTTIFGVADTVFDCGSGVVRWCAHHLQHLGSPWGIGGNAPHTPGMAGQCLVTFGRAHTHHHNHIWRSQHRM